MSRMSEIPAARHKVPRSTIHIVAQRCWQAAAFMNPRYVYLTDRDAACARQDTEYLVAYAAPVEGADADEHFMLVAKFPMREVNGDLPLYKTILLTRLKDAWPLAKARGLVP